MSDGYDGVTIPLLDGSTAAKGLIRDTNPLNTGGLPLGNYEDYLILANNTLNQAGNLQIQHSLDGGVSWFNLGAPIALGAASGIAVLAIPSKLFDGLIRASYTASVAPASGSLILWFQFRAR